MSRKSIQRDAILQVIKNTTSHPGVDWIYDEVRKEIPNISLGTVYRNLRLLAQAGEIRELDIPGSAKRFDGDTSNHRHLICEKCGRIFDLYEAVDPKIEARIFQKTGFKVKRQYLKLIGLCSDCQKQEEQLKTYIYDNSLIKGGEK
ncbi:MAG: transcriptional repressor [Dehalococcoidales bacterium]|nr:transcriptional repressor [Dehalococcoidales bacterium]